MHVKIQCHGDNVQIARAFTIAEKRALNTVCAREQTEFRCRNTRATVVVRVQTDGERVAIFNISANPFNLVGINIRHRHLDGVRQIQDHLPLRRRLPHVHDRLGDFLRKFHFRCAETFRRILEHDFRALEPRQAVLDEPRAVDGNGLDFVLRLAEHNAALRGRG